MDASFVNAQAEISRRDALRFGSAALGSALAGMGGAAAAPGAPPAGAPAAPLPGTDLARAPKRYPNKKSINLWAFPYPQKLSLKECFALAKRAGFEAMEVNFDLENDLSPKATEAEVRAIGEAARAVGLEISGLCTFLYWPYPLSAGDPAVRARALELAERMLWTANWLGAENLLVVPGAVYIPWRKEAEVVPYDVVDRRAREAVRKLLPLAEKLRVNVNVENIFFNGYLMSPPEMIEFVDSFKSPFVRVHFDTGNIMPFQFPEHWIPLLGKRIQNVHLKEYSKKGTDFTIESFRPLLDGTTDWPAVMNAFDSAGYQGYLTFEYFHPFQHYPEALIYQTSDAMDRMLGRG
jgi:hexulose-6-phosphate isomerase